MTKHEQAIKIGCPVFLTAVELDWLQQHLLEFAQPYANLSYHEMSIAQKINFCHASNIAIKCAKEI
jgi:hypothetical protein